MRFFDIIPPGLKQSFNRVHRTSGLASDSYGDATFTEVTSTGYRGFFQLGSKPGETIILAGKEVQYDGIVYTQATALIYESDRIVFGSSRATTLNTRYVVEGIIPVYNGATVDHKAVYVKTELV